MNRVGSKTMGNRRWFLLAALALVGTTTALFAEGHNGPMGPAAPGVYFENNGQNDWAPLRAEQAQVAELTASGDVVQARLDRGQSRATLYAPARLAVRTHESETVHGYRVYRLRASTDTRTVRLNKPVPVRWVEIGLNLYEARLPAGLGAGDFAILPPVESADRIYSFHYEPLRAPGNPGLALR